MTNDVDTARKWGLNKAKLTSWMQEKHREILQILDQP